MQNGSLFIRVLIVLAALLSLGLVYCFMTEAEKIYEPGVGTLGNDASNLGQRTAWSKVMVPANDSHTRSGKNKPELGDTLFVQWCSACHGDAGKGDGALSKALNPPPRDFTKGRFRFSSTPAGAMPSDGDLYRTVTAGVLPSRMPSFSFLNEEERWALVEKVKRLSVFHDEEEEKDLNYFALAPAQAEIPAASLMAATDHATLERGKQIFESKAECAKCHGVQGRGDGPSASELKAEEGNSLLPANLRRGPSSFKSVASASDLHRVLVTGLAGTPMPSYANAITESEMRDLVAYVSSLWKIDLRGDVLHIPGGTSAPEPRQALVELGEKLFRANCAGCHGKLGRGDGPAAVFLNPKPGNLAAGVFKFKNVPEGCFPLDEDLKKTLRQGVPGTSMPAWRFFSDSELQAIVEYLRDLGEMRARVGDPLATSTIPRNRLGSSESIESGKKLFVANCAVCHGDSGRGDGQFSKILQDYRGEAIQPRNFLEEPMKAGEDAATLFRTISHGFEGTPMPGFAAALSETERWDLVSYVASLRRTQ